MASIIYGIVLGAMAGALWGSAFGVVIVTGAIWGGGIGLILALVLGFSAKAARIGGNLVQGETSFVNNSILTFAGIAAILCGGVALGISYLF